MTRRPRTRGNGHLHVAGSGAGPSDPQGPGPSPEQLKLIQGIAADMRITFPEITPEDSIHFAAQAVNEQAVYSPQLAGLMLAAKNGDPKAGYLVVDINHHAASLIDIGKAQEVETVATFGGPTHIDRKVSRSHKIGYAVARALFASPHARAILYACGMRIHARSELNPYKPAPSDAG